MLDVTKFGVIADPAIDNTQAIRKCLLKYKNLYFPPGIYKITGVLPIADNQTISGAGPQTIFQPHYIAPNPFEGVFVAKCMYDNLPIGSQTQGFKNITLQNFTVDIFTHHANPKLPGNLPNYAYSNGCFWFYPPAQSSPANFTSLITNPARRNQSLILSNIRVIGGPYFYSTDYTDRFGRGANGNWNLNMCAIDGVQIRNCYFQGSGRDTINAKLCNDITIENCIIKDSEDDAIVIGGGVEFNIFYNPFASIGSNTALYLADSTSTTLQASNAIIRNNSISQCSANGIKLFRQHNAVITCNIFEDINCSAIIFQDGDTDNIIIQSNICTNIGNYANSVLNLPTTTRYPFIRLIDATAHHKRLNMSNNVISTASRLIENSAQCALQSVVIANNILYGKTENNPIVLGGNITTQCLSIGNLS